MLVLLVELDSDPVSSVRNLTDYIRYILQHCCDMYVYKQRLVNCLNLSILPFRTDFSSRSISAKNGVSEISVLASVLVSGLSAGNCGLGGEEDESLSTSLSGR